MLKVTTMDQNETVTLKIEGRLAGPWVQEVTRVWVDAARSTGQTVVVDLSSVTFIDSPGRALLAIDHAIWWSWVSSTLEVAMYLA